MKKKGCFLGCLLFVLGIFAILVLLVMLGVHEEKKQKEPGEAFLRAALSGNPSDAYTWGDGQLQESLPLEQLQAFFADRGIERCPETLSWSLGKDTPEGWDTLKTKLPGSGGEPVEIQLAFVKQDGGYRVAGVGDVPVPVAKEPSSPDEEVGAKIEPTEKRKTLFSFTTAKLKDAYLATDPENPLPKPYRLPDDTPIIYCVADLHNAMEDTAVEVVWFHQYADGSLEEIGRKTLRTGSATLTFTLKRKSDAWLSGQYGVALLVEGKETLRIPFTISVPTPDELSKKAESGDAMAAFRLGRAYLEGDGVTPDVKEAIRWLQASASAGNSYAQASLAILLLQGQGVPQDAETAVALLRKSAAQGNAEAEYNLGVCYHQGLGVESNMTEAILWTRMAADKGYPAAQYNMGLYYKMGIGVTADPVEAKAWFTKAAAQDFEAAKKELAEP